MTSLNYVFYNNLRYQNENKSNQKFFFFSLYCFFTMDAEASLSDKLLFQHGMLGPTPRYPVFMLVPPTPLLFERCLTKWLVNHHVLA